MNKYGAMLRRQWEIADPKFVQSLNDPTAHFSQLGEQVSEEILELLPSLEGTDPAEETYLEKVGRLSAAKLQAEEIVLAEYQPASDSPEPDEPEGWDSMPHDQQESWIRENIPAGEEQQQMLKDLESRRLDRMIVMGASYDPQDHEQD
ncbi:MAG: TnpV protein [Brachybacterium sp.]|uniref:TnpV protein n=1 Tax=Brachybacterium alimentarium TaxID=47845 RepID=UPI000DF1A2D6|nr:TnpV protein [Brachybacterium alimentarium]MDN6301462.1 TnpV protein [Brachybacterium sp.]MDN6327850.1 TnpV protein [Brachybacterium sp.]RCS68750.1 TnpV protein [Brachybacterium alimentarium]